MPLPRRLLPGLLRPLLLMLAVLCVLAQPVLAVAHEQHEIVHKLAVDGGHGHDDPTDPPPNDEPAPGSLDGLLHAFDCCLHATAVPAPALVLKMPAPGTHIPASGISARSPAPLTRLLRPPIQA